MQRHLADSAGLDASRGEYFYHKGHKGRRGSPATPALLVMLVLSLLTGREHAHKLSHKRRRSNRRGLLNEGSEVSRGMPRCLI